MYNQLRRESGERTNKNSPANSQGYTATHNTHTHTHTRHTHTLTHTHTHTHTPYSLTQVTVKSAQSACRAV